MASRDKVNVDMFHKNIQYALEKLGKSKSGFERTVVSKFKRKRRVGSGNELVDYSRAPCLGADQKARGLWERDWPMCDAEKDWHERSFRASGAINGCQKSPLDKPEMTFSFLSFKLPVTSF